MDIKSIALSYFTHIPEPVAPTSIPQTVTSYSLGSNPRLSLYEASDPQLAALNSFTASLKRGPIRYENQLVNANSDDWVRRRQDVSSVPTRAPPPPPMLAPPQNFNKPTRLPPEAPHVARPLHISQPSWGAEDECELDPLTALQDKIKHVANRPLRTHSPTHIKGPSMGDLARIRKAIDTEGAKKGPPAVSQQIVPSPDALLGVSATLADKLNEAEQAITHHQNMHITERAALQLQIDKAKERADECEFKWMEISASAEAKIADLKARVVSRLDTSAQLRENWLVKAKNDIVSEVRTSQVHSFVGSSNSVGDINAFRRTVEELLETMRQYQAHADAQMTELQLTSSQMFLDLRDQLKGASYLAYRTPAMGSFANLNYSTSQLLVTQPTSSANLTQSATDLLTNFLDSALPEEPVRWKQAINRSSYDVASVSGVGSLHECGTKFLEAVGHIRTELTKLRMERVKFETHFLDRIAQLQMIAGSSEK